MKKHKQFPGKMSAKFRDILKEQQMIQFFYGESFSIILDKTRYLLIDKIWGQVGFKIWDEIFSYEET